jgi:NAD(P)-dependent dehydrogenase (short-subunit alcohol dehydrogenase family)
MAMSIGRSLAGLAALGVSAYAAERLAAYQRLRTLNGKSIAITGGSRGLGLALARCALGNGARVAICARDEQDVRAARLLLKAEYGDRHVFATACDVRDAGQAKQFIEAIEDQWGRLDVLINNAGVIQVGPWQAMTDSDFAESLDTHVWGPLHMINAAYPALRASQGRIVNIASIGGKISVPHLLPYNTGKFGLVGLSEGLAVELAHTGISVTTVCPGLMRTGSPRNAWFKGQHRQEYAWFSISDCLPFLSVSARAAARRILAAAMARRRCLIFPLPIRLAAIGHELAPGLTVRVLAAVNRLLPSATESTRRQRGWQSTSSWSPSMLTILNERAAQSHNQFTDTNGR